MKRIALLALALIAAMALPAAARTREDVREAWRQIGAGSEVTPYAEAPRTEAPYAAGELTDAARRQALDTLNFVRWLADVPPVAESALYDFRCQRGAVLLAALDYVDHDAPCPEGMDPDFYESAHQATAGGSIVRFNWMRPAILKEGVEYFLRDDGDANLAALGHRRWALNPLMAATGFGLANSAAGNSYVVMYAHDISARPEWDSVRWPCEGPFPAELMHDHLAWSIVLNPARYDIAASRPVVTLSESGGALTFRFDPASGEGDGWCAINGEGYGAGPCLIFRPDFSGTDFTDYQQNQRWTVRVDGLRTADGAPVSMEYAVEMISLAVQDAVNVEISPLEAALKPGDALRLAADVVPAYADDLTVLWRSTDESVATVDDAGLVTAVAPGECEIVVRTPGGLEDRCAVTVRN